MSNPWDVVNALAAALGVISVANGYNTDIGTNIVLYDQQRGTTARPSIAIGARTGKIDLRDANDRLGNTLARQARQMDFALEAGLSVGAADAQRAAHDALEDIERVYMATLVNNNAMPTGVARISFTGWQILDRPDGIDAVVLQILGVVDYRRSS